MTRSRTAHAVVFVAFFLVLVSPWIAGRFGATAETVERRTPAARPSLRGGAVFDVDTFAELNDWVRDATPLRGDATGWVNGAWLELGVSAKSNVVEGPGDTLFLAEDFTRHCARDYELSAMTDQLAQYGAAAEAGGKEFVFLVASDKGAILDHRLDGRAEWAAACSRDERVDFRAALDASGVSFDLAPTLIAADREDPGRWYYEHDSHWTFDAGGLVAQQIVDHFEPELFDPAQLGTIDRSLPIRGDIYSRLGILKLRDEPDPVQSSLRSDVTTELSEAQIGGTRTVRTYRSTGDGRLIEGRTVVVHDSMMNFAELQLASYFEQIEFVHWFDLDLADFTTRVAEADRVIMLRVERDVHSTIAGLLIDDTDFVDSFTNALRAERDDELALELEIAADALRRFTQDTGSFAQRYDDLRNDPGADGWAGPYLDGDTFATDVHPRYGTWGVVQSAIAEGVAACATLPEPPCGSWISLSDVPEQIATELDVEFDSSDGFATGRLRLADDGSLLFYTFAIATT